MSIESVIYGHTTDAKTHIGAEPEQQPEEFDLVIEAGKSESLYWLDLYRFRELLYLLAWRDILVRYKQTLIGIAWAVLRPVLVMAVFTLVFGRLANLSSEGIAYPVLVFSALLPWQFFSNALSEASNSMIINANLITKVYFPRLLIPLASIVVGLVDFAICLVLLLILMVVYSVEPTWRLLTVPLFALLACLAAVGPALWLCSLNVRYRDVRYTVPFIVQFGLLISPVGFSSSIVPERWRLVYSLNPMVGVIDGFRWAICGSEAVFLPGIAVAVILSALLAVSGIWYFRSTERSFADII
jgi:lipopolysaccharide transport system permease protein